MPPTGLKDWSEIKAHFRSSLLVGNGASIALHESFNYKSLLAKARANHLITGRVKTAFDHFDTTDFEYVLNMLWHAHHLNNALGVNENKTTIAYLNVRRALIRAVKLVHPEHSEVLPKLDLFADFLRHFDTVLSLNYDLLLYWARMHGQEQDESVTFKDCFLPTGFDPNWRRLRKPIPPAKRSTLVFYPHGNLALVADLQGNERKVFVSTAANLLQQIQQSWESEDYAPVFVSEGRPQQALGVRAIAGEYAAPVFVSEGRPQQKLSAIYRSNYLATVYNEALPDAGVSLAVFGWRFGDADDHILHAPSRGRLERIAVSMHTANPEWRTTRDRVRAKIRKAFPPKARPEVVFYESVSVPFAAAI